MTKLIYGTLAHSVLDVRQYNRSIASTRNSCRQHKRRLLKLEKERAIKMFNADIDGAVEIEKTLRKVSKRRVKRRQQKQRQRIKALRALPISFED
jgi:hypothetical protein